MAKDHPSVPHRVLIWEQAVQDGTERSAKLHAITFDETGVGETLKVERLLLNLCMKLRSWSLALRVFREDSKPDTNQQAGGSEFIRIS